MLSPHDVDVLARLHISLIHLGFNGSESGFKRFAKLFEKRMHLLQDGRVPIIDGLLH